jgi:hypothetical protein
VRLRFEGMILDSVGFRTMGKRDAREPQRLAPLFRI